MISHFLSFDAALRSWVITHRVPGVSQLMLFLSTVGRGGVVWLAAGGALAVTRRIRIIDLAPLVFAIALGTVITDNVLKGLVNRARPFAGASINEVIGSLPEDRSFPSGHTTNAFAGAGILSWLVPQGRMAWWTLAVAIGYSRVYLGVHYPFDVLGGALVGLACAAVVRRSYLQVPRPPQRRASRVSRRVG